MIALVMLATLVVEQRTRSVRGPSVIFDVAAFKVNDLSLALKCANTAFAAERQLYRNKFKGKPHS